MCFSSTASFVVAGGLSGTCMAAMRLTNKGRALLFAATPLFFSMQQAAEGYVWLALGEHQYVEWLGVATSLFAFFAYLFWPIWIPLVARLNEPIAGRQRILNGTLLLGMLLSGSLLIAWSRGGLQASIVNHSISYSMGGYSEVLTWIARGLYLLIALSTCYGSSLKGMSSIGALLLLGFVASNFFFYESFASIWCYAAAVTSVGFYFVLRSNPALHE